GGPAVGASPREAGHVLGWEAGIEHIGTNPDHGTGIEHRIDARTGMVTHDQAAELQAGGALGLVHVAPHAHLPIGVLQIARVRIGPQVAPLPDDAVAKETIMALVAIAEEHA